MASYNFSKLNLVAVTALPLMVALGCGKNDSTNDATRDDDSSTGGETLDDGDGESTGGDDGLGGAAPSSGGDESTGGDDGVGGSAMGGDTSDPGPPDVGDGGFVRAVSVNDEGQLDLLFVIDNSISMADKQALLAQAVPQLVQRLTNPDCINNQTHEKRANPGSCPDGYTQEARAFDDMHVGILSSSLGGHGSGQCARNTTDDTGTPYHQDDRGRLNPTVRDPGVDVEGTGFLAWNGEGDTYTRSSLTATFTNQLNAVGERGCGFEAPLEAWYRFLVDPQPPAEIIVPDGGSQAEMTAVDEVILSQREAFLRPESWVAIVVLTDENDCSAMDGGSYYSNASYGWLVPDVSRAMKAATEICDTNPNDKCCFSCLQAGLPPEGCEEAATICESAENLSPELDRANVRCFENQKRFGVDLLYPTDRYVNALSRKQIIDARDGSTVDNPLLMGVGESQGVERNPGMVFFAGIVGVPWQDLASPQSLSEGSPRLDYLTAVELAEENLEIDGEMVNRWELILGDPGRHENSQYCKDDPTDPDCGRADSPPLDPFMIESIDERPEGAENPITGDVIVASTSNDPQANAINGHETNNLILDPRFAVQGGGEARDDLQYACIFELDEPTLSCTADNASCDCGDEPLRNRALCQEPGSAAPASNNQYFGKAYPGTRILRVLRDFGENAIVGSICPKFPTGDPTDLNFGYNPILQQLVDRVHVWQAGSCFADELPVDEEGALECAVVEARRHANGGLDCSSPGRAPLPEELRDIVHQRLEADGHCGGNTGPDCATFEACAILELEDDSRNECLHDAVDTTDIGSGFCYIDPALTGLNEDGNEVFIAGGDDEVENPIVSNCSADSQRMVRFAGVNTPAAGALSYVICDSSAGN